MDWETLKDKVFSEMNSMRSKPFHLKMLLLTGGGIFVDGYNIIIISFGLAGIEEVFHPSAYLLGLIGLSVIIGNLIGALIAGYVVDRIGRKTIFILDLIFFVGFAILSGLVTNAYELLIARILVGIGIGLDYPIATSYLSEFTPVKPRGKYLVMNITFFNIAGVIATVVAYWLLSFGELVAWRYMLISAAVPALIVLLARLGTPESPRWLLIKGRKQEAKEVIEKVTGKPLDEDTARLLESTNVTPEHSTYYKELLTKHTRDAIFIGVFYFLFAIAFLGTSIFGPEFESGLHLPGEVSSIIFWSLFVVGDIIAILTIDKWGRRTDTLIGWAGMTAMMIALILLPRNNYIGLELAFTLFAMFQGIGPASTHMVYSPELFPTRIRATAEGWKQGVGRLGGVLTGVFFPAISLDEKLYIIFAASLLGFIWSLALAKETKGKSLEEISEKTGGEKVGNKIKSLKS
ncbi:MFS transporter [Acidianus sp. HS-5]|uniref:MFS transporter n=1 Tax=Acidianus sp. HS-5 TaxID=2886040 RepID=UPI001F2BEC72|nr:MFS transporter [Acidianus sp. HS-5]BDC17634.1 MFS transporter [Acidianus sp. HS-5]